jgi:hypothetical protein
MRGVPDLDTLAKQLDKALTVCENLRIDKFHLQRKLFDQSSAYNDLKSGFLDL